MSERCVCCADRIDHGLFDDHPGGDPWEGRMDDYCHVCRLCRCDAYPGECRR